MDVDNGEEAVAHNRASTGKRGEQEQPLADEEMPPGSDGAYCSRSEVNPEPTPSSRNDDNNNSSHPNQRRRRTGSVVRVTGNQEASPQAQAQSQEQSKSQSPPQSLPYRTAPEYAKALNQWMVQCYYWQCFYAFNCPLLSMSASSVASNTGQPLTQQQQQQQQASPVSRVNNGRVYILPKVWKRAAAEVIDFLFLLVLKVLVTYIAVDYFDLIDLNKYDLNLLEEEFDAYQMAYELSSEIIIIEMIHRLLVIAFETFCLQRGQNTRSPGGATPGKALLGLKVVSCSRVDEMGNGTIRVTPAKDIGILWSLLRALIKNLSSVFFLPASLTVFVSAYNRAAYDVACKCIVVEEITANAQPRRGN